MKRIILILLFVTMLGIVLTGCNTSDGENDNGSSDSKSKGVIGVIPKSTLYDYWQYVRVGAEEAAKAEGYEIIFQGTAEDTDAEGQVNIVEDFITQGVEAIAISPTHPDSLIPVLERADEAGIPVIIIDGQLNSDVPHSTVSTDNHAAAAIAAEKMAELAGTEGDIAIVSGAAPGSVQDDARINGFKQTIEQSTEFKIANTFYSEGDRNKAVNITQDIFSSISDIKGIFATNEGASIGIAMGVGESSKDDVVVIGFDSSEELLGHIVDGVVAGTVSQNPYQIGFTGVENVIKVLNGEDVEEKIDVEAVYIDANNIEDPEIQKILNPLEN